VKRALTLVPKVVRHYNPQSLASVVRSAGFATVDTDQDVATVIAQ
jgi:hypothetical protein